MTGGGDQSELSTFAVFLKLLQLKYIICQCGNFGVVCPEPHHLLLRYWTIQEVQKDTEGHRGSKLQDTAILLELGEQGEK